MRKVGLKNVTHTVQNDGNRKRGINYLMTLCKCLLENNGRDPRERSKKRQESIDSDSPVRIGLVIIKLYKDDISLDMDSGTKDISSS